MKICYINNGIVGIKEKQMLFFIGKVKELNELYFPYNTDIDMSDEESIVLLNVFLPIGCKIKKLLTTLLVKNILQEYLIRTYSYGELISIGSIEYIELYTIGLNTLRGKIYNEKDLKDFSDLKTVYDLTLDFLKINKNRNGQRITQKNSRDLE